METEKIITKCLEIILEWGRGYTGKLGIKPYVAAIYGTDPKYGLKREFLDADRVERDHFGRNRYKNKFTYCLLPGLYESKQSGDTNHLVIWTKKGETVITHITKERAHRIAKLMDDGVEFDEARQRTRPSEKT